LPVAKLAYNRSLLPGWLAARHSSRDPAGPDERMSAGKGESV
jgi:hypothetical protein